MKNVRITGFLLCIAATLCEGPFCEGQGPAQGQGTQPQRRTSGQAVGNQDEAGPGRNYGRSIVMSQQGIAATSQVIASQVGDQIPARGASAVDAAIASNAVLGLTEPLMTGIGGDLFVIYWDAKTGRLTGLNSSGAAPMALTPEFLAKQGIDRMPGNGIHSVTV